MARKKEGFNEWTEEADEAAVEAEVSDTAEGTDKDPKVTIKDEAPPKEPELSETTKAEMEAGRKAVEDALAANKPKSKDDEPA